MVQGVITDESKFEVFGSHRQMFVRRLRGEHMKSQCVTPTVMNGGRSVMVWGCFAGDKVGDLVRINGRLNEGRISQDTDQQCSSIWQEAYWSWVCSAARQ